MINKTLKWSLILVVLLSVLFPVGAYFFTVAVFILAIIARKSRQILAELLEDKSILIMFFCVMLSVLYSRDKLMSIIGAVMVCLNLGLYLVLTVELKNIDTQKYYKLLNAACLAACIYGIYQYASGNLIQNKSWVDEQNLGAIVRVYSTLLNPNIFAGYLAINLSFGIARFQGLKEDIMLSSNIILSSICLLLTYSRGGFAAFGTAMFALCLLKERKKGVILYLGVMIAAFFVMNSALPVSRAGLGAVYRDSSSLYRLEIWKAALNMFLDNPIFGHGIGTTWYYLSGGSEKLSRYVLHSHNIYLQIAAEMGTVGFCAFTNLIIKKVWECYKLLKKYATEEVHVIQGFVACIAGIAVHGLIDAVIFVPALSLIFMGYFALYSRVVSEHSAEFRRTLEISLVHKLIPLQLFNSKGILKLFGSESADEDKYQEEESNAYQA